MLGSPPLSEVAEAVMEDRGGARVPEEGGGEIGMTEGELLKYRISISKFVVYVFLLDEVDIWDHAT